jgi:hypothetical protein
MRLEQELVSRFITRPDYIAVACEALRAEAVAGPAHF